jgi:hypothetical protein
MVECSVRRGYKFMTHYNGLKSADRHQHSRRMFWLSKNLPWVTGKLIIDLFHCA